MTPSAERKRLREVKLYFAGQDKDAVLRLASQCLHEGLVTHVVAPYLEGVSLVDIAIKFRESPQKVSEWMSDAERIIEAHVHEVVSKHIVPVSDQQANMIGKQALGRMEAE